MKIHHWFVVLFALCTALAFARDGHFIWAFGFGEQESEQVAKGTVRLVFFEESGAFLPGVEISVRSASGREWLNTTAHSHWLSLDLPDGSYTVRARRQNGQTQSARLQVDGGRSEVIALQFAR